MPRTFSSLSLAGLVPVPPADEFNTLLFEFYKRHYIWIERDSQLGGFFCIVEDRETGTITTDGGDTIQEVLSVVRSSIDEADVAPSDRCAKG